jgi:hypothetical protein
MNIQIAGGLRNTDAALRHQSYRVKLIFVSKLPSLNFFG